MVNRSVLGTRISHRLPRYTIHTTIPLTSLQSNTFPYLCFGENTVPKILDERKDAKGNDTFVLCDWWRCNSGELPNFAFVLRAVLSHSPNSCPPERLFSIFNAEFDLWKNERAVDRRPTRLPHVTRHFACCACATCSPRGRKASAEGRSKVSVRRYQKRAHHTQIYLAVRARTCMTHGQSDQKGIEVLS